MWKRKEGHGYPRVWDKLISTIKSYPGVNPSQLDAFFSRVKLGS